ncbi:hypothetical protein [Algicola sagamiensis]|uniref:hypothetical protein n=1 Tax=Algicola sagamiensis TaxID=163869 RepID=UPI0012F83B62|nr:hypothetical protein [Algicola sagamiensis]
MICQINQQISTTFFFSPHTPEIIIALIGMVLHLADGESATVAQQFVRQEAQKQSTDQAKEIGDFLCEVIQTTYREIPTQYSWQKPLTDILSNT